jgi:quinol-cytochrome oxidoreductase complex cytochrome b subunit
MHADFDSKIFIVISLPELHKKYSRHLFREKLTYFKFIIIIIIIIIIIATIVGTNASKLLLLLLLLLLVLRQ